jgi:hypothetical protein
MTKLSALMLPLRRAARAFFRSDVALKRDEAGLRLTLEDRTVPQVARPPTAAELAAERQRQELKLMLSQLTEVLDELPETRETMRHLVFVEQALQKKGLRALKKMPLEVLKRALDQFEGLITNWSPDGLANLRSKMAVAVIDRETFPDMTEPDGMDSMFDPERVDAVIDPPRVAAARVIEAARQSAFEDSTIERLALEFGVARPGGSPVSGSVELQGDLDSPSGRALARSSGGGSGGGGCVAEAPLQLRDMHARRLEP